MYNITKMREEFIKKCGYEPTHKELMQYIKNNQALNGSSENTQSNDTLTGIFLIIWFISSIVSLIYLSAVERETELLIIFGHYFLVFGIMIFLSKINVKNYFWLFILGLCFIGYVVFSPKGIKINMDTDMFGFLVMGAIFFVVGVVLLVSTLKTKRDVNLITIDAVVSDYLKDSDGLRACVYEFEFEGNKYNVSDNFYTNVKVPAIGDIKQIKIKPDNPGVIITEKDLSLNIFLSIPFILMGGLFIIISLFG